MSITVSVDGVPLPYGFVCVDSANGHWVAINTITKIDQVGGFARIVAAGSNWDTSLTLSAAISILSDAGLKMITGIG